MEKYAHITKMENIMVYHENTLNELERTLAALDTHCEDYQALMQYYYSEQRNQDLLDDENGLIPDTLSRGVLSEDELFDLVGSYRDAALHMLELAVKMLKA